MSTAQAKFARYRDGLPHFAEVEVEVDMWDRRSVVETRCSGMGWSAQGHVEDVPARGGGYYDAWEAGARVGAMFAMQAAEVNGRVSVVRISGLLTDTNPSIVAMAAALAVWRALGVEKPPSWAVETLESRVFGSWEHGLEHVPTLGPAPGQDDPSQR